MKPTTAAVTSCSQRWMGIRVTSMCQRTHTSLQSVSTPFAVKG